MESRESGEQRKTEVEKKRGIGNYDSIDGEAGMKAESRGGTLCIMSRVVEMGSNRYIAEEREKK